MCFQTDEINVLPESFSQDQVQKDSERTLMYLGGLHVTGNRFFSSEDSVFHHLYEQARLLYNFASLMTTHSNHKNCSELAPTLTMTEVHLLVDIMEQPGIGVSELGRLNLKTRGAISQMVKKLEQSGMITKSVNEQHARILDLHLTPLGLQLQENMLSSMSRH